ncbi:hypothetical protein GOX01_23970 [Gluconobacter oxydans]|nr:hypothetical protein GOX01_23970 [Gluconobacter oxydans]
MSHCDSGSLTPPPGGMNQVKRKGNRKMYLSYKYEYMIRLSFCQWDSKRNNNPETESKTNV